MSGEHESRRQIVDILDADVAASLAAAVDASVGLNPAGAVSFVTDAAVATVFSFHIHFSNDPKVTRETMRAAVDAAYASEAQNWVGKP